MSAETRITDLQQDIAARLASDCFLADVPVFTEYKRDLVTEIAIALGTMTPASGKSGVCAIVMQPVASVESPNVNDAIFKISLTVLVVENVLINTDSNGTGKAALTIATRIVQVLHQYSSLGICAMVLPQEPCIVPVAKEGDIAYEVRFTTTDGAWESTAKVATPVIASTSDTHPATITLSGGTDGAAIYYTLNRSHPCPQNAAAIVYTAPFAVDSPAWIRAGAFQSDSINSDINLKVIL